MQPPILRCITGLLVCMAVVVVAVSVAAQDVTPVVVTTTPLEPAAITSTAIVEEATRRAVEVEAQGADGLSAIEQTATALVMDMLTPLPFDEVPDAPPLPGPDSNTGGDDSPDFSPLLVIGAALLVIIAAGGLARLGSGGSPSDDDPETDV